MFHTMYTIEETGSTNQSTLQAALVLALDPDVNGPQAHAALHLVQVPGDGNRPPGGRVNIRRLKTREQNE